MRGIKGLYLNALIVYKSLRTNVRTALSQQHLKYSQYRGELSQFESKRNSWDKYKANIFKDNKKFTDSDWQRLREDLCSTFKHINESNVDVFVLELCNSVNDINLSQGYIRYLKKIGNEPNIATLGRLLKAYYKAYQSKGVDHLPENDEREILSICDNIQRKYNLLDGSTCESIIYSLLATRTWKKALKFLDMIKLTSTPSTGIYSELIVKAFQATDFDLGWKLMEDMEQCSKSPRDEVFTAYIKSIVRDKKSFLQQFEKLLEFLEKYEIIITEDVVKMICRVSRQYPDLMMVTPAVIDRMGKCENCTKKLNSIALSDADYRKLENSFLNRVLIGSDVFQKSTPQELAKFKEYIARTAPYDCVIDGLNAAYSTGRNKSPKVLASLLASVVKYFIQQKKCMLVLGRKHMDSWPVNVMNYIRSNTKVYLTNNLTDDDPFLLYATLKSGPSTNFFSRDFMRSHAYRLGPDLKSVFRRWQLGHQYSLVKQKKSGEIIVKEPTSYLIFAHKTQSTWHVPYHSDIYHINSDDAFKIPDNWLCVQLQT